MASTGDDGFEKWLNNKLRELNTDETVFSAYITGILEGDEALEDKTEALEGILSEIIENDINIILSEILEKWTEYHSKKNEEEKVVEDVDTKLARLMDAKKLATTKQKQYTPEELRIREQILAQYSQLSADEDEEGDGECDEKPDSTLTKNTNAYDVQQAMKERREQAKLDSQNKKLKDKEDREKQKQQREEKKEKRKTVKGERRR